MVYYNLTSYNSDMFLSAILSWWYGDGFIGRLEIIKIHLIKMVDFFSIDLMLTTLFNPFRQISANYANRSFDAQLGAFFDNLISRFVGFLVRFFMILTGSVILLFQMVFSFIGLAVWLVFPLLPAVSLILCVTGFVLPW